MKVTVLQATNDRSLSVEVEPDELVENLKAILEVETNVPLMQQQIIFQGQEVLNSTRLDAVGVRDNDMLMLVSTSTTSTAGEVASSDWAIKPDGSAANPVALQTHLRGDPVAMGQLQQRNPEIASAVLGNDIELFQRLLRQQHQRRLEIEQQQQEHVHGRPSKRQHQQSDEQRSSTPSYNEHVTQSSNPPTYHEPGTQIFNAPSHYGHDLSYDDPFDVDTQRRIEEAIRQKNVDENWEAAIEHNPEAFARVIMLYVDMEVNGVPLKAFVDSGAQSTIISRNCAERCGLLRLLDRRYVGIAKGVGQSPIVGRIHVAPLKREVMNRVGTVMGHEGQIGRNYYPCSFTVLDQADLEFIFGLDMLRKHQCTIDLKDNVLSVGGGEIAVPFLQEKDLPLHLQDDKQLEGLPLAAQEGATSSAHVDLHPPVPVHAPFTVTQDAKKRARSPQGDAVADAKVQRLVDLGFELQSVLQALSLYNGNEEQAASYLFGG